MEHRVGWGTRLSNCGGKLAGKSHMLHMLEVQHNRYTSACSC